MISEKIKKAHMFAFEKHKDQKDDSGESYFDAHICQVVRILNEVTKDEDIICAGFLHDTLEDTDTTFEELVENFGGKVGNMVLELTKQGYNYFPNLQSKDAIIIKYADRLSNLSRMKVWDKERIAKYLEKSKFWKDKSDGDPDGR